MVHLRMAAGESHCGMVRRGVGLSTIVRLGEVSPLSPGVGTSPELFLGFGASRTALKKPTGLQRIGISAPLSVHHTLSQIRVLRGGRT